MERENPIIGNQIRVLSFAIGIDEFDERTSFLLNLKKNPLRIKALTTLTKNCFLQFKLEGGSDS